MSDVGLHKPHQIRINSEKRNPLQHKTGVKRLVNDFRLKIENRRMGLFTWPRWSLAGRGQFAKKKIPWKPVDFVSVLLERIEEYNILQSKQIRFTAFVSSDGVINKLGPRDGHAQ